MVIKYVVMIWPGFMWPGIVKRCTLKNKLVNNWVTQKAVNFLTSYVTIPSQSDLTESE